MTKLLPGEMRKKFTVYVEDLRTRNQKTDDGRPVEADLDFTQYQTYTGMLRRLDGKFTLLIEYVDRDGVGHRFALPDEVVRRVNQVYERCMADARSERALNAAHTRRQRLDKIRNGNAAFTLDEDYYPEAV